MRTTTVLLLSLVFMVCAGACAGRQRPRSGLHSEPRQTSASVPDLKAQGAPVVTKIGTSEMSALPDETAPEAVAKKPVPANARRMRSVQEQINVAARQIINENNAWLRAVGERVHGTRVPPSLPDNDALVASLRVEPDRPVRPNAVKASTASTRRSKTPLKSTTRAVTRDARVRPPAPQTRGRASVASIDTPPPSDHAPLGVVSSALTVPPKSPVPIAVSAGLPAQGSVTTSQDASHSSAAAADRPHRPSDSNLFLNVYLPAILFAVLLGSFIGYVLRHHSPRTSSFDTDVIPDTAYAPVFAPNRVLVPAPAAVPVHVAPSIVPHPEAPPPTQFPEGSNRIITSSNLGSTQMAVGEIDIKDLSAPTEAHPPDNLFEN